DDLGHQRRHGIVGPHAGVEDPGGEQRPNEFGAKLPLEPGALGRHGVADERAEPARAAVEELLEERLSGRPAPGLLAEKGEDEPAVGLDIRQGGTIGAAVAGRDRVQGRNVLITRLREQERSSVWQDPAGGHAGGDELETTRLEIVLEQRIVW